MKAELRDEVEPHRDPAYAAGAQAYMKSSMPYLGVRMPDLRRAWRVVLDSHPVASERELREALRELWDEAEYREERYAALALLDRYPQWVDLALLERLVVEGAWWDYVDTLARKVGGLLRRDARVAAEMRRWSRDENLGSGGFRSSASSASRPRPTSRSSTTASSRTSTTASSSSGRRSAGRFATTRGTTPARSTATCASRPPAQPALPPRGDQEPRAAPRRRDF